MDQIHGNKKYHQEFCKIRNKVKSLTRQAKREYEKSIAIQAKSNPKKFWNYARSKTKVMTGISDLDYKDESGQLCTTKSEEEKAHVLGEFFRSVYTKEPTGEIPKLDDRLTTGVLKNVDITNDRVKKILGKLKTNKSPGVDGLHPRVLNELGGGPGVVVSTAAFHAKVRGSVPGIGGLKETKIVSSPSTCES